MQEFSLVGGDLLEHAQHLAFRSERSVGSRGGWGVGGVVCHRGLREVPLSNYVTTCSMNFLEKGDQFR